jgi:hypothetical protein
MKTLDLPHGLFEVIYEEELRELTRSLSPLLLMVELRGIDNQKLAEFINGFISANDLIEEEAAAFTINVHHSNIIQDIKRRTRGHLRLAIYPKNFGNIDVKNYEKAWLLVFDTEEDHRKYLENFKKGKL